MTKQQLKTQLETKNWVVNEYDRTDGIGMVSEGKAFTILDYHRTLDEIAEIREELDSREVV